MKKKFEDFIKKYLPGWAILPLLTIVVLNCLIYWGSDQLTSARYHYDFTGTLDRMVPLVPAFIWIYILAFPFWAVNYILAAQRGKDQFYRFVATDLTIHLTCFVIFLILPTTNVRPEITGNSWSEQMLQFVYAMDGGNSPSNLFPSIHCYAPPLRQRGIVPRGSPWDSEGTLAVINLCPINFFSFYCSKVLEKCKSIQSMRRDALYSC